jgi:hypothetical protein
MLIEDLRRRSVGDRTRIEARITYEDADLPPLDLYYEADSPLAGALEATPEAFVTAAFPMALWMGERRLKVEGALDTTLAAGLKEVAALLAAWFERCGSLTLEPVNGFHAVRPCSEPRAVALFSGGVDAMTMLCENRRLVPLDHPHAIRTMVHAFGYSKSDCSDGVEDPFKWTRNEAQHRRIEALGERVGFEVVRLETNVLGLHPDVEPFYEAAHSAGFLAPLVASPSYVTDALIASTGEGGGVPTPHGSHPMLDILYSTGAVRVHHTQPQLSRLEKLGLIAEWEPAYDTLQVCTGRSARKISNPETANCGKCEKCVRTMLGLLIWKALPRFTTFPHDDVTTDMIDAIKVKGPYCYLTMPDLHAGLESIGRSDLVRAIQAQVNEGRWARTRRLRRVKRLKQLREAEPDGGTTQSWTRERGAGS